MKDIWPGFDFEYFREAKRSRVGVHNPGLGHWQLFLCPEGSYREIAARIRRPDAKLSLHHPFITPFEGRDRHDSSQFLDADEKLRNLSFHWLADSLEKAVELGAEFVVTHLNHGHGVDDLATARVLAGEAVGRFAEMSRETGVPIHVEFLGYHPAFHAPEEFVKVLAGQPDIRLCLDSGHLHRREQIHGGDVYAAAETLAPLVGSLHLWNVRSLDEYRERGHVPVHPTQRVEDGYVDVEQILRTALTANPEAAVIFEPSVPEGMTAEHIAEGVDWVRGIVAPTETGT